MVDELRSRYLDLIQASVSNTIHGESAIEGRLKRLVQRLRHPWLTRKGAFHWPARAHTMLSQERLTNVRTLVEATLRDGVPGDYIETGIWRGGTCILMRAVLAAHGVKDRRVVCADSFEGLPPPSPGVKQDRRDRLFAFEELAVSVEQVKANFAAYDLLDGQVVFLKGFFRDTLPTLPASSRFALIRLDGDMYESTMDALTNLYDKLSPGGYCIIDDYGALNSCRQAVHDYLDRKGLKPEINVVDVTGVWWRKDA